MGFFAESADDPRYAMNMGLFQGIARGDVAGGIMAAEEGLLKKKLTKAQLDNYASEIEARKLKTVQDQRQQALVESFFPGIRGAGATPTATPAPRLLQGPAASPALGAGTPQASPALGTAQPSDNDIMGLAKRLGIPPQAIQADLVFNGGKKISELLAKHGARDMQVSNGYAYDKNNMGAGYLPQLNVSQDGKTSMVQIGADGLPVVSAPSGALNTYAGYRNLDESAKANFDPVTLTPRGQNPQMMSRGALMRQPQVQGTQIAPEQQAQRDQGRTEILQQEMARVQAQLKAALQSGDAIGAQRAATDVAGLNRELGRMGPAASPASMGLPLQSEAEKTTTVDLAKADTARQIENTNKGNQFKDFRDQLGVARTLLSAGPTNSGVGAVADNVANMVGMTLPGAAVARALDTTSKWLVQNVPKAPGAQSDAELRDYQGAAGLVGDKTVPVEQRLKALDAVETLINTWEKRRAGGASPDGETAKPATVLPELPKTAPRGQRVRDKETGKILKFNGMTWVEDK